LLEKLSRRRLPSSCRAWPRTRRRRRAADLRPGKLKAHRGDADGALADRCRAHELDPENFAPVYSSAFLLEREGRQAEAAEAWRQIVDFATGRALELTAAWPRQELQRLAGLLAECKDTGG